MVEEAQPAASTQVGRPSPVVRPRSRTLAIAVNPEVDSITIGLVSLGGLVLEVTKRTTTGVPTAEQAVTLATETIQQMRRQLGRDRGVTAIGIHESGEIMRRNWSVGDNAASRNAPAKSRFCCAVNNCTHPKR